MDVAESCWLNETIEVRQSGIEGRGLFARAWIRAGSVVARLGGELVTRAELEERIAAASEDPTLPYVDSISVSPGVDLLMPPGQPIHFGNHSCDPNVWHEDVFVLVARRDVRAGEELTVDYATQTDNASFRMVCRCGSPVCRGVVTGEDWRRADLRGRYGRHWVPAVLERMKGEASQP